MIIVCIIKLNVQTFLFCFKIPKNRVRQRISRPIQRTTTTTTISTEDTQPNLSTESYSSKANRRRKFRPEYTTTSTPSYEEAGTVLICIQC